MIFSNLKKYKIEVWKLLKCNRYTTPIIIITNKYLLSGWGQNYLIQNYKTLIWKYYKNKNSVGNKIKYKNSLTDLYL